MADVDTPPLTTSIHLTSSPADMISAITRDQLENALDASRRRLRIYQSLKSVSDVIGTQYGDRVLFELLQNAHDAHEPNEEGEIAVRLIVDAPDRGTLLVANKGRSFSTSNLEAIRNIGTSDKEIGEGIGNKGLGFRSVEALTDDVHIYSATDTRSAAQFDGYCFRFATVDEIAGQLEALGATTEASQTIALTIPRYLVPVTVQDQSVAVRHLSAEGYATVIALPLASKESIDVARKQVAAVLASPAPVLLFLDRLAALDVAVVDPAAPRDPKRLTRQVTGIEADLPDGLRMERVKLDSNADFLLVRQTLPKARVLDAVRASIAAAPPLKRWLQWKGDAVVSVAVPLDAPMLSTPRLFNFLPMDERAVSPMAGHIDAPFFADIDRRSIKADLPLNKYLIEAAARTAAQAALAIVDRDLPLPETSVVDLAAWSGMHMPKIVEAFAALKRPLAKAAIWPVVSGGPSRWESFNELFAWPDVSARQLTPSKLATVAHAAIVPPSIGEGRLGRMRSLASAVSLSLDPSEATLSAWVEAIAEQIASLERPSTRRWRSFYDDVAALYTATKLGLSSLEGKKLFPDPDGKLLAATAKGLEGAPPVFHRFGKERGKRNKGPPAPPPSLSRKFRFVGSAVEISDTSLRAFEKAGLLRRYDPMEALASLKGALGEVATDLQRREALIWSYRVWRNTGGKAVEDALRGANLSVPCLGGWKPAAQASFSSSWSTLGRTLEQYLHEAAAFSSDANREKDALLVGFAAWPRAASDDRREDWLRFLGVLGIRDGLQPIAGAIRRSGTPSGRWNSFLFSGEPAVGLGAGWTVHGRTKSLSYPQTEYQLKGEAWRLPGQWNMPGSRRPPRKRSPILS